MFSVLEKINEIVWGIPALVLILGIGLYLSVSTGFIQIKLFPCAMRSLSNKRLKEERKEGEITPFQALCTALAATVGTGNLAGVAGAICIGGPGAVFWMWISALLGMVTKFAEATLATKYSTLNASGEKIGGPMYMIHKGMGENWKWMASVYAFFGIIASFGVGNATQVNTVVAGVNQALATVGVRENSFRNLCIGLTLSALVISVLLGGAKRIGNVTEQLIPVASASYIILGLIAVFINNRNISAAFQAIFSGAFMPRAVTGGMIGSMLTTLRVGTSRGVFTNEAGMGTASMAHAGANVKDPVEQGLMGIVEVFLDTIVICTLTALVILCSGVEIPYGTDVGIVLTTEAFCEIFGSWTSTVIAILLCLFAFATILGWGFYGIRCTQYLFGERAWKNYIYLQGIFAFLGAIMNTETVWLLSDILNALMAIPNLIALGHLSPELKLLVNKFKSLTLGQAPVCRVYD